MPQMQWLQAQHQGQHLHLQVWLDTQKTATAQHGTAQPDPAYVKTYRWSATPPKGWAGGSLNGTAYTTWQDYVLAEAQLLAAADYAAFHPATTELSVQGQVFTPE